jgi:hypothetical protein
LSNAHPGRTILHSGKRHEDLREREIDVTIAEQDKGMK